MATGPESAQQKWGAQLLKLRPQRGGAGLGFFRRIQALDWQRWSTTLHRSGWRAAFYGQRRRATFHWDSADEPTNGFSQRKPLKRIAQRLSTAVKSLLVGQRVQRREQRC